MVNIVNLIRIKMVDIYLSRIIFLYFNYLANVTTGGQERAPVAKFYVASIFPCL